MSVSAMSRFTDDPGKRQGFVGTTVTTLTAWRDSRHTMYVSFRIGQHIGVERSGSSERTLNHRGVDGPTHAQDNVSALEYRDNSGSFVVTRQKLSRV